MSDAGGESEPFGNTEQAVVSGSTCDPDNATGAVSAPARAFLDVIAWAEGTSGHGKDGYNITFGYHTFSSCDRHPNILVCEGICSHAAGRYQFQPATYADYHMPNFWPENQDRAARLLALDHIDLPDRVLTATEFANAVAGLNRVWASFPPSYYNQPTRTLAELREKYCSFISCGTPDAGPPPVRYQVSGGDFNGDGKTDLLTLSPNADGAWNAWAALELSNSSNTFTSARWNAATPQHMRNGG
ncbi:MAG TPA: hypothetical protein VFQ61_10805, partial [Polyangiaceae bacterium]|nr:hypothetical protein [Polyangiaceae bacterium]